MCPEYSYSLLLVYLVCFKLLSAHASEMADFLPAATVGSIPTVFIGWVVGLVCGGEGQVCWSSSRPLYVLVCWVSSHSYLLHSLLLIPRVCPGYVCLLLLVYLVCLEFLSATIYSCSDCSVAFLV